MKNLTAILALAAIAICPIGAFANSPKPRIERNQQYQAPQWRSHSKVWQGCTFTEQAARAYNEAVTEWDGQAPHDDSLEGIASRLKNLEIRVRTDELLLTYRPGGAGDPHDPAEPHGRPEHKEHGQFRLVCKPCNGSKSKGVSTWA